MSEIEQLRARVEELEYLLGITASEPPRFNKVLAPKTEVICTMFAMRPFLSTEAIEIALEYNGESNMPAVYVCKARRFFNSHGIKIHTAWGRGWYLSEADRATVRDLFGLSRKVAA